MKADRFILIVLLCLTSVCKAQVSTILDINMKDGNTIQTILQDGAEMPFFNCDEDLEMVDLGLSVKWAKMNVGATRPNEMGEYYLWGDTINSAVDNVHSGYQRFLLDHIAKTKYDVAYKKAGKNWRMPTAEEFQELIDKCKWIDADYEGTKGYLVIGQNGNYIFMPDAGYVVSYSNTSRTNSNYDVCAYWTDNRECLYDKTVSLPDKRFNYGLEYIALPVRPVYDTSGDKWLSTAEYISYTDNLNTWRRFQDIVVNMDGYNDFMKKYENYLGDNTYFTGSLVAENFEKFIDDDIKDEYMKRYYQRYDGSDSASIFFVDYIDDRIMEKMLLQTNVKINLANPDQSTNAYGEPLYTKNIDNSMPYVECESDWSVPNNKYYLARPSSGAVNPVVGYKIPITLLRGTKYNLQIVMAPDTQSDNPLPNYLKLYTYTRENSGVNMGNYPSSGTLIVNPADGKNFYLTSPTECFIISHDFAVDYATEMLVQLQANVTSRNTSVYSRTLRIAEIVVNAENEYLTGIDDIIKHTDFIDGDDNKYDLLGRKTNSKNRGIYIIKGKKVFQ